VIAGLDKPKAMTLVYASPLRMYTNVIAFGLSRPAITPTIYHTHGKHANHYILSGEADTNVLAFGFVFLVRRV
jgi:hypothetical protein